MKIQDTLSHLTKNADDCEAWLKEVRDDKSIPLVEVIKDYWRLKGLHEELKAAVTRIYNVMNSLEKGEIPARMTDAELDMVRIPELARSFSLRIMTSASMLDKDKAFEWVRGLGHEDLIQETINSGTLAAFCRNLMLEQGIEPPDDVIKVTTYNTIGSAKYTPK